jgi:NADH:ubiquinone oxidoreductase subunit 6 (subunit J)
MAGYIGIFASHLGIPIFLLAVMIIWSAVWKLLALWKAGRKNSLAWFIVLALVNTLGILEILYIFVFSEMKPKRNRNPPQRQNTGRKRRR